MGIEIATKSEVDDLSRRKSVPAGAQLGVNYATFSGADHESGH